MASSAKSAAEPSGIPASALAKLLTPLGWELLRALPPYDESQALTLNQSLRSVGVDLELAAALLTQSRLRARAHAKFGEFTDGMLFTPAGLEQATRLVVAAMHANRYRAAGCTRIADLTCGIGADSLAFAGAGLQVVACDLDDATAAVASWNLRMFDEVEVRCADGLAVAREEEFDGLYADPGRRGRGASGKSCHSPKTAGGRTHHPDEYQPPLAEVLALRDVCPALGVKVGPGLSHDDVPADAEAQWVSVDGDVVECGLWFGPLAPDGPGRTALLLRTSGVDGVGGTVTSRLVRREPQDGAAGTIEVGPVGEYLFEPDGAVIRAGLLDVAAAELGARQLDSTIAYLTGDRLPHVVELSVPVDRVVSTGSTTRRAAQPAIATAYHVVDVLPSNVKRLKAYLRERNVGRVTIKKRGTAVTPEQLRPQLALRGDNEATLVLTRIDGQHSAIIAEPVEK